jgi:hypothetical protein
MIFTLCERLHTSELIIFQPFIPPCDVCNNLRRQRWQCCRMRFMPSPSEPRRQLQPISAAPLRQLRKLSVDFSSPHQPKPSSHSILNLRTARQKIGKMAFAWKAAGITYEAAQKPHSPKLTYIQLQSIPCGCGSCREKVSKGRAKVTSGATRRNGP